MRHHPHSFNQTATLLIATLSILGCGSEEEVNPRPRNTNPNLNSAASTCVASLKTQDTDQDGITDYNELYGFTDAAGNKYYTDPEKADTDGDGYLDGNELATKKIHGSTSELAIPVALHPLMRDYVVRIYARGSIEGMKQTSAEILASTTKTGWNQYAALRFPAGKNVMIQDLRLGAWSTTTNNPPLQLTTLGDLTSNLSLGVGSSLPSNYCDHRCLLGSPRALLVYKHAESLTGIGSAVELLGHVFQTNPAPRLRIPANQEFLLLRANDRDHGSSLTDSGGLADNTGFQTLLIRLEADANDIQSLRPQRAPTSEEYLAITARLCDG